jgi:glycerol-3-phosphate acyltransferase PlsY
MNAYSLIKSSRSGKLAWLGLVIVQATDMGKGALAIYIAGWLGFLGYSPLASPIVASAFVILGHNYPFYFKFRQGGRGLASLMGILLGLNEPSLGVWAGTIVLSIIAAQYVLVGKPNWKRFSNFFSILGSQDLGRIVGIGIALVPLYFFDPQIFFPILAATILVLIKHTDRIKVLLRESREH